MKVHVHAARWTVCLSLITPLVVVSLVSRGYILILRGPVVKVHELRYMLTVCVSLIGTFVGR